jgi:heat shock protein HslJ
MEQGPFYYRQSQPFRREKHLIIKKQRKMIKVGVLLSFFQLVQLCSKSQITISTKQDVIGKWVLKGVFLGDALDGPCGYDAKEYQDITLEIVENPTEKDEFKISGRAAVNQYFGGMKISSFENNKGKIDILQLGSTKMAGPEPLMACELRFFNLLNEANDLCLKDGKLQIGQLKNTTSPSRDGGTYLIFEKK